MKVAYFIYEILKERVDKILLLSPKKYKLDLPVVSEKECFFNDLYDLVFIIEKYKKNTVRPQKYKIRLSPEFNDEILSQQAKKNYLNLIKLLENGDSINSSSLGFLPNSSREYFRGNNGTNEKIVDFKSQIYGINHFHLDSHNRKEDFLLYYVLRKDEIFFLKIGSHMDLNSNDIIKILITEYPDLAQQLNIIEDKFIKVKNPIEFTGKDKKEILQCGGNPGPVIVNDKIYTSLNYNVTNRTSIESNITFFNIKYQVIDAGIRELINHSGVEIHLDENIIPLKYENGEKVINGFIIIGDKINKIAYRIKVSYLESLEELDERLNIDLKVNNKSFN